MGIVRDQAAKPVIFIVNVTICIRPGQLTRGLRDQISRAITTIVFLDQSGVGSAAPFANYFFHAAAGTEPKCAFEYLIVVKS